LKEALEKRQAEKLAEELQEKELARQLARGGNVKLKSIEPAKPVVAATQPPRPAADEKSG
jgi:hypothetical protein